MTTIAGVRDHHRLDRLIAIPGMRSLIGIVSIGDVVKHRLQQLEQESAAMHDYIQTA